MSSGQATGGDSDLLLGRRTCEILAAYWPFMDDEIGRKFNAIEKYVGEAELAPRARWAREG